MVALHLSIALIRVQLLIESRFLKYHLVIYYWAKLASLICPLHLEFVFFLTIASFRKKVYFQKVFVFCYLLLISQSAFFFFSLLFFSCGFDLPKPASPLAPPLSLNCFPDPHLVIYNLQTSSLTCNWLSSILHFYFHLSNPLPSWWSLICTEVSALYP